jgi:hypothetical protein
MPLAVLSPDSVQALKKYPKNTSHDTVSAQSCEFLIVDRAVGSRSRNKRKSSEPQDPDNAELTSVSPALDGIRGWARPLLKFPPLKFSGPEVKEDEMLNFFNQRRAWNDLIVVFLKCGCSGAGLTISAAMAITVVAWRVFGRKAAEESTNRLSTDSTTTNDVPSCCHAPQCISVTNATAAQIPASLD